MNEFLPYFPTGPNWYIVTVNWLIGDRSEGGTQIIMIVMIGYDKASGEAY